MSIKTWKKTTFNSFNCTEKLLSFNFKSIRNLKLVVCVKMPRPRLISIYRKEFSISNCFFENDPDIMVRSQWRTRSRNNYYILYRWFSAMAVTVVLSLSMYESVGKYGFSKYFIFMTHWCLTLNVIVHILGAILVTKWHAEPEFKGI